MENCNSEFLIEKEKQSLPEIKKKNHRYKMTASHKTQFQDLEVNYCK